MLILVLCMVVVKRAGLKIAEVVVIDTPNEYTYALNNAFIPNLVGHLPTAASYDGKSHYKCILPQHI